MGDAILVFFLGILGLLLGTFITTWLVMLGWGSAYNNGLVDQAPGYWVLYFPVLCFSTVITMLTYDPNS